MRKSTAEKNLTFDAKASVRSFDENGFMRVKASHITKAVVNPYYGREIPGWREAGLDPDAVYYGLRDPEELKASLETWAGLPLHIEHHIDSADEPAKLTRVGAVGAAVWNAPYVDAPLTVWDQAAIDAIKNGSFRELSCAYRYDPDFTPGVYEGIPYDFVMRDIRGNHVALVEEGRAGPDVVVADAAFSGAAQDAQEWRTAKNGKKYQIDTETGEIVKGNVGRKDDDHFGPAFPAFKGKPEEAIEHLLKEKKGHVPGVFHKEGLGDIDLPYGEGGKKGFGLAHIIERREQSGLDGTAYPVKRELPGAKDGCRTCVLTFDDKQSFPLPYSGEGTDSSVLESKIHPSSPSAKPKSASNTGNTTSKNLKGALMKFKKWFRGAQDDNPEIEKQEVELAQAIIDLHKVDPVTGEIVDITEDEDKAEEIRKIIGELSAKLEPEDVKRLTDSLTDLAYSKATGDEKKPGMDEEMKKAMDKCGLDAEDPAESRAFAEGVKYGEELERNPEERGRLDREHESEGMKKAMDSSGLDAENPQESKAFAEGVKYGEELIRNPEERRKLDREHESEGERRALGKDEDKNAAIERILASVPGLTPERKKKLTDALSDLAYSPATGDEDPDEAKTAQDRALRRRGPRPLTAMDAARIKASAVAEAQEHMRGLSRAVRDVRGLVGELDPLSFDSASDVYGYALEQSGINPREYPRQAWRGMVDVMRVKKAAALSGGMARDAAPIKMNGKFAGLNNISIAD